MSGRAALCIDDASRIDPSCIGLSGENLESQSWLEVFPDGEEARSSIAQDEGIERVWVVSCDDVEPINLAATLKEDRPDLFVSLVHREACGSVLSRAHNANIDEVLDMGTFVRSYSEMKGRNAVIKPALVEAQVVETARPKLAAHASPVRREEIAQTLEEQKSEPVRVLARSVLQTSTFVMPIVSGSGMKTKTCEAMMYGKVIFGTQESFEGYQLSEDCILCEDEVAFINNINTYLESGVRTFSPLNREVYLQNYENAFILVSHDVSFLNAVTNVIWHVEGLSLTRYTGSYEKFEEMAALKRKQQDAAYARQQAEIAKEKDFIARNKARVATRGMANSRQKRLDKMEVLTKRTEKPKAHFHFEVDRTPSRFVIEAKRLVLGYDAPLTTPVDIRVERGKKIAIRGTNGLGKSTLLKTLLGMIPPISGTVELGDFVSVGYFEQESPAGNQNTALDEFWQAHPGKTEFEVRAALAACGLTNEHITTKMMALSGGEAARVRLAKIIETPVNLLVLDEPTNHLDVDAKKELRRALEAYKGTLLLVSHEPEFYEEWVDSVWNIERWTTKIV